jgi:exodeoxyribonuclease V alpha subunit
MSRGSLGARALNGVLQQALNPEATPKVTRVGWTYAPGDKVIQTVNNYDKDVCNGDIGRVVQVDLEESQVEIGFDSRLVTYDVGELDEVALAYAATAIKVRGRSILSWSFLWRHSTTRCWPGICSTQA